MDDVLTSSGTERYLEFVAGTVIVAADLLLTTRYRQSVEGSDLRRVQVIQGSIDMPPVKAGDTGCFVLIADDGLVERFVVRVLELGLIEALRNALLGRDAISNKLDLRLMRNSFEVGVL